MWSEKLNNRKSDGGMTGDVCYIIFTIDRSELGYEKIFYSARDNSVNKFLLFDNDVKIRSH